MSKRKIAIVGMSCRFPGAHDLDTFWTMLQERKASIQEIPHSRFSVSQHFSTEPARNKSISKWAGLVDNFTTFDPEYFSISPREAELMDPQQRVLLELAIECFEDAGYGLQQVKGKNVGVFIGACNFDYKERLEKSLSNISGHLATGTYNTFLPNRISHSFDLKGPSIAIDTACSSSLVALSSAIQSIQDGDCDSALVGGVSFLISPTFFVSFSQAGMLSPTGSCKPFDKKADGYVRGEGAGLVYVKPLEQAIADNDRIYGVVDAVAVNHGGKVATVTSPSAYAQANVIKQALSKANLSPSDVTYIEAHGTGTPKGDPIEINGLKRAFRSAIDVQEADACYISCVKPNIGHLESAAGISGLIKGLLSIQHRTILPIANLQDVNPKVNLTGTRFKLATNSIPWRPSKVRKFGVSSFGFGGVSAHAIISEHVDTIRYEQPPESTEQIFCFSALSNRLLRTYAMNLASYIEARPEVSLSNIAYTLARRTALPSRAAIACSSRQMLLEQLTAIANGLPVEALLSPRTVSQEHAASWTKHEIHELSSVFKISCHQVVYVPPYPFDKKEYLTKEIREENEKSHLYKSELCAVEVAYQQLSGTLDASASADNEVIVFTLLNSQTHAVLSNLHPDAKIVALPNLQSVQSAKEWIKWYLAYLDFLKAGIEQTKPVRCILISDRHTQWMETLYLNGISLEKEFGLACQWFELCLPAEQFVQRALSSISFDGRHGSGHFKLEIQQDIPVLRKRTFNVVPYSQGVSQFDINSDLVVFITGGAGGIGLVLGKHLAEQFGATVWLSGRRPIEAIGGEALATQRGKMSYVQADCTDHASLQAALSEIQTSSNQIDVIVHSVGQIKDKSLFFKSEQDVRDVVEGKVLGCEILDELTQSMPIKQFITFSSITGLFGNPGQTDYAAANAYLSGFTTARNEKVRNGQRFGASTVLYWPYWQSGGMQIDEPAIDMLLTTTGTEPLGSDEGKQIFLHVLQEQPAEICIVRGKLDDIKKSLSPETANQVVDTTSSTAVQNLGAKQALVTAIFDVLGIEIKEEQFNVRFSDLGIDSIAIQNVARDVSHATGTKVTSLTLAKYSTIAAMVKHLESSQVTSQQPQSESKPQGTCNKHIQTSTDVALIGMSLRTCGSDNWRNGYTTLVQGDVAPSAFPQRRWDMLPGVFTGAKEPGQYHGFFLDSALAFDHKFFGISRREAMLMDPQHRLLLEEVWNAIVDAGYTPEQFSQEKTAVFVCIDANDYAAIVRSDHRLDEFTVEATTPYLSANRISYIFNLEGPSETLNVACASVYSAIEKAQALINSGVVSQAVISASQLNLIPERFDMLDKRELLSKGSVTRPFDADADGFVRSEGVGCLILKALDLAEKNSDQILAKVKSAASWHSGRGLSLTTPNPLGHIHAMKDALCKSQVNAQSIKYIEAHGTGSKVGDLAEAQAIEEILAADQGATSCVVSSLKSNIGHLEVCSGIASCIRAVMSIRHQVVPGVSSLMNIHPEINTERVKINTSTQPMNYKNSVVGLLAYGLGGVSSFALLEPYTKPQMSNNTREERSEYWIGISANDPGSLIRYASSVIQQVSLYAKDTALETLEDTLKNHRVHLQYRLLVKVDSYKSLTEKLCAFVDGKQCDDVYLSDSATTLPTTIPEQWQQWMKGQSIDTSFDGKTRSFWPSYPFDRAKDLFIAQ